jgi:iron-sulfur cluster assembly protein
MDDIKITPTAAEKIKKAAIESQTENLPLRIAVSKNPDGSFHYGMGFDDVGNKDGNDHTFSSNDISIVVAQSSYDLLKGTTVDYAELEPKQFHFVFLNPNDPNYSPGNQD